MMTSYSFCLPVSGLFHLAEWAPEHGLSMLFQIVESSFSNLHFMYVYKI